MRLRFLGTGTSSGVPAIGCDCAVCTSADPRDKRLRTSAALEFTDDRGAERVLLIDAGPDLRQQALAANMRRLDAVFFTHNHVDHTFGLDEVRRFNVLMDAPVDIYAEEPTLEHLRRVYAHIFEAHRNVQASFVATVIAHRLSVNAPVDAHGVRVTPLRLLHGRLPVLGFRFDRPERGPADDAGTLLPLAYCTDVSAIPPETWGALAGVRTLVVDALRHRRHPTHFTLEEALLVAERVGAERTLFVHMSHDLGHAETQADLPAGVALAYDGLVLE